MRQKLRRLIAMISLLLFPVTLNFLSPYVSVDGAINGIVSGSILVFIFMFLTGIFFRRAWCSYICPVSCLSDISLGINQKNVNRKVTRMIRYSIFTVWAGVIITMFILAGGIKGVNPLHLTEQVVSVDSPLKFINYYFVLLLLLILTLTVGKRGACQSICWMSPFLTAGAVIGKLLRIPQIKIKADSSQCVGCGICDKNCPMSIPVSQELKKGYINTYDCILCGECVDHCKKKVLQYRISK
ncbi:MAG: 4Fe-4S binding protein [Herbinix sp.]|jgi:polyferredoxin|nr:4Fe-4S binding protein [Herbinix sp.]